MKLLMNVWRPLLLATLLTLIGYTSYLTWLETQHLRLTSMRESRMLTATAQTAIEHAQRHDSRGDILETLQRMERSNPGLDVIVFDARGEVFLHSAGVDAVPDEAERDAVQELVDELRARDLDEHFTLVELHDSQVAINALPLRSDHEHLSGYVAIALHVDYVEDGLRQVRYVSILVMIVFVLLNFALGIFMGRARILVPVRDLLGNIERIRNGEEVILPKQQEDELGHVQKELVGLASSLEEARLRLEDELEAKRRLQITLQARERLAAVGLVAASLAHEIGSPLQVVMGRTQSLARKLEDNPELLDELEIVSTQLERIERTMHRTLTMTRHTPPPKAPLCIRETIDIISSLLRSEAENEGIDWELDLAEDLPTIMGDSDQIQQILFNLLNNALAWTHSGGKICIRARASDIEDILGNKSPALCVEVIDTGEGMTQESISRIFETFFTARAVRGGTGLGMPIVRHLVREHHGRIKVESEPGEGTTVQILFPAIEPE